MMDSHPRKFTHEASTPAILLLLKDGMIQKAVLYGSEASMVYVREEGRGGFGILPTETATDFLAFDDLLTQEPVPVASTPSEPAVVANGATLLAITVKSQ